MIGASSAPAIVNIAIRTAVTTTLTLIAYCRLAKGFVRVIMVKGTYSSDAGGLLTSDSRTHATAPSSSIYTFSLEDLLSSALFDKGWVLPASMGGPLGVFSVSIG